MKRNDLADSPVISLFAPEWEASWLGRDVRIASKGVHSIVHKYEICASQVEYVDLRYPVNAVVNLESRIEGLSRENINTSGQRKRVLN